MLSPHSPLLVVDCGDEVAGVGALRWLADAVAEVKRMYVPDRWRGAHLGSAILDRLIDQAAAAGATAVRLDTVRFMTDAQRLYRSRGFTECPADEETEIPSRLRQHWLFFERRL